MQLWKSTGIVEAFESVEGRAGDLNSVSVLVDERQRARAVMSTLRRRPLAGFGGRHCSLVHGSGMPKSRQIFLARWSEISLCLGIAERLPFAGLPHHE